ncbi:MAG: hypothetical protein IKX36_07110 [Prevotella sp.]|nr:hypothetical protein [Prevotella sp.]
MRKFLLFPVLALCLLSVSTSLYAQEDGEQKKVRMFLNDGDILDFNYSEIDSITATPTIQKVWKDGNFTSISIENIDSIWYVFPTLRITAKDLDFGKVAVGNSKTTTVTLNNDGQYPESYFLWADGVFSAKGSGMEFTIGAGEAQDVELTFSPESTTFYSGKLILSSNAIDNGLLDMPIYGRGVATENDEKLTVLTPEETDFEIILPDGVSANDLEGFKIVNSFGEFPAQYQPEVGKPRGRRVGGDSYYVPGLISPNWLQTHFLVDNSNHPFLFTISMPGENTALSVENTAIALLMTEPLLITSDEAEYRNTVKAIKGCGQAYKDYVAEVRRLYLNGVKNQMCPDYSSINTSPVIYQLIRKVWDNSELSLDGVSLAGLQRTGVSVKFRLHNNLKRVIHAYPSRVKMAENNVAIAEQKGTGFTLLELFDWMMAESNIPKSVEDIEFFTDMKAWIGELEQLLVRFGFADPNSHIQMPIIVESKDANYWKIVKGSVYGDKSSVFEVESENIEVLLKDPDTQKEYDKAFVDIYGMGHLSDGKHWDDFTPNEKFRSLLALIHSAYKDVVKPLMDLAVGIKEAYKATGPDKFNYDFRYGERKNPELLLAGKLLEDFFKSVENNSLEDNWENAKELKKNIENGDWFELIKQFTCFVCDRVLSFSDENPEDKRTYINLIYNIYKKYTNTPATSETFRATFKGVANNLTQLKRANFVGQWIKISENALNLAGIIEAFARSQIKQTFVIDKSDNAYISVITPKEPYRTRSISSAVHFEWDAYMGSGFGNYLYDLEFLVVTPDKETKVKVDALTNIDGNSCDYNITALPDFNKAVRVMFRIIGHHPEYPDVEYARSDLLTLMTLLPADMPEFVDMGFESGTLWANRNLGAASSHDNGNYYAWGELSGFNEGKNGFSWKNYKYCKGTNNTLTKYCTKANYGNNNFTDGKEQLESGDDVVSQLYGKGFSIPSKEDWEELIRECYWSRFDNGVLIRSKKNGNVIFLPKAGYRSGLVLYDTGVQGYYWSTSLDPKSPDDAWYLLEDKASGSLNDYYRSQGRSIRPVFHKNETESTLP